MRFFREAIKSPWKAGDDSSRRVQESKARKLIADIQEMRAYFGQAPAFLFWFEWTDGQSRVDVLTHCRFDWINRKLTLVRVDLGSYWLDSIDDQRLVMKPRPGDDFVPFR